MFWFSVYFFCFYRGWWNFFFVFFSFRFWFFVCCFGEYNIIVFFFICFDVNVFSNFFFGYYFLLCGCWIFLNGFYCIRFYCVIVDDDCVVVGGFIGFYFDFVVLDFVCWYYGVYSYGFVFFWCFFLVFCCGVYLFVFYGKCDICFIFWVGFLFFFGFFIFVFYFFVYVFLYVGFIMLVNEKYNFYC